MIDEYCVEDMKVSEWDYLCSTITIVQRISCSIVYCRFTEFLCNTSE